MEHSFCPYCMAPIEEGKPCGSCGLTQGSYTPSPHHLPPGTVLRDRYLVGRVLGEGGFGITYIGCDLQLELKVAIKEYFPSDKASRVSQVSLSVSSYTGAAEANYDKGLKKFLQEARAIARMDKQPVIVNVRDFFESNHTAYIVMEYVDGTTFRELVEQRGGRIPAGELLYFMEPLFFALKEMHSNGLIHRDISPENLMIEKGEVRLLDFGCARESADGSNTLTIALKHGYAPVEQYQSKGQGPWTDVYALAATIYYCLTGRRPPQAMDRLMEDELIPPRKLGVDLTAKQEQALLHGLGVVPRRRFQSMEEFHTALYEGVVPGAAENTAGKRAPAVIVAEESTDNPSGGKNSGGGTAVTERAHFDPAAWLKKNKLLAGGAAAALALVIVLAVWKPWGTKEPDAPAEPSVSVSNPENEVPTDPPEIDGSKEISDGESLAMFENAVTLAENDEDVFRALLADPAVEAVYLEDVYIDLHDGELAINKPVWIGQNSGVGFIWPVTVGEGGHLRVMGAADVVGLLRTADGGSVLVGEGGRVADSGMVWLERESDLVMDGGEMRIPEEKTLVFCEEEVFANAAHVNSYEEYITARGRRDVDAIVIDSDISLEGHGNKNHTVPVLISEGVTVTAPVVDDPAAGEPVSYDAWDTDGTVLVNRGTLRGRNVQGAWENEGETPVMLNYGTVHADFYNGDENVRGILVNMGTMSIPQGDMEHANLVNLGTLLHGNLAPEGEEAVNLTGIHDDNYYLNFWDCGVYNSGVIRMQGAEKDGERVICGLMFNLRCRSQNVGSIEIGEHANLTNQSRLRNFGEIHASGSGMLNNEGGIIDNCSPRSVLDAPEPENCLSVGIIQAGPQASVDISRDTFSRGGALLDASWGSGLGSNTVYAGDAGSLLAALADDSVEAVVATGESGAEVSITLDEPLTVDKVLCIANGCRLTAPGLTVQGKDAFLLCDGGGTLDLAGGELRFGDGSAGVTQMPEDCGGIVIQGNANVILTGGPDLNQGAEISVSETGYLTSIEQLKLDGVHVTLRNGILRSCGGIEMVGCTVDAGQDAQYGELLINGGDVHINADTVIHIYGSACMEYAHARNTELGGTIINDGELVLVGSETIQGHIVNNGALHVWGNPQCVMPVYGSLENNGTVYFENGGKFQVQGSGAISGVPEEYVA